MNYLKAISVVIFSSLLFVSCNEKNTTSSEISAEAISAEKQLVIAVMKSYKDAFENLTTEGTMSLFIENSKVYESGGVEGTYANYIEHHIGPELSHFNSFKFSDYTIDVEVDLPYAFTTETYIYTLDIKANPEKEREAFVLSKKGVATSILKKIDGDWKIIKTHSSSRNVKKK